MELHFIRNKVLKKKLCPETVQEAFRAHMTWYYAIHGWGEGSYRKTEKPHVAALTGTLTFS